MRGGPLRLRGVSDFALQDGGKIQTVRVGLLGRAGVARWVNGGDIGQGR